MKEAAIRERRNFTKAEEIAAKFPSRNACPLCWLNNNMTEWDSVEVYNFLKDHYWPPSEVRGGRARTAKLYGRREVQDNNSNNMNMALVGKPISKFGLYLTATPLIVVACMFLRRYLLNKGGLSSFVLLRRKSGFCAIDKNKSF